MSKIPEIRADKGDVIGIGVDGSGNIIGKNINVVINQVRGYGLALLKSTHFNENSYTDPNFDDWKNGFNLTLESIFYKREYRRESILEEIRNRLEKQGRLLLLGESGSSKTTILMELICHYFDKGYKVLYSEGNEEPKDPSAIAEFIKDLIKGGNKVFVALDNMHDKKMAASFYVIKDLQSFYRKNDVLFLLCARQPEYDILLEKEKFAIQENYRHAWESLFVNIPNQNYDLKPFTENEIKEFVSKYKAYLPDNRKQRSIEENASEIFKDTRGHPIMVKFSVFQRGLRADVEDRYGRYLIIDNNAEKPRSDRISTVIICSLFHISTLQLTDELLDKMGLIAHANDLDRAILYSQNDKTWKTLHPRWDEELLIYIFSFRDKNLIQIMKNNLSFALQKILRYCDERTILIVANTLYATIIYVKVISTDILDEIFSNIPASFSDKFKINLYIIKGRGLQGLGRHIEAIAYYDQALRMDPNDVTALHNKGLSLGYLEKIEDANSYFDKVLEIDPNDVYALGNKGFALYRLGKLEQAITYFDKVLEIDAKEITSLFNKGLALYRMGKLEQAITCYDKVLEIGTNHINSSLFNKGFALYRMGKLEQAITCYDKVLEIDANHITSLFNKGLALYRMGKLEQAIACYDKVLEIDANHITSLFNKGVALEKLGRYEESIEWYDKALTIDPNDVKTLYNKGVALGNLGKYEIAIEWYDKALTINPAYIDALNNKGISLGILGNYTEALDWLDKVLEIDPEDVAALNNKGKALYSLGKLEEAITHYDKALGIDPKYVYALANKNEALRKLGKRQK